MNIWNIDKLILFIAFIVPGFIAIKTYELFIPSTTKDSSKQIIDAVSYSCLNYAIMLFPIYLVESSKFKSNHSYLYILFYIVVLFLTPILIVCIWKLLRTTSVIQKFIPHPTQKPWDYFFSRRICCWVIVTLKNGDKIGGMYGPIKGVKSTLDS
jgi:chromate transport protein ChrA